MANKPLPQVTCPKCHLTQALKPGQTKCIHRGCEWVPWEIAIQLGEVVCAGYTRPLETRAS